jgi:hypothetical protein
MHNPGTPASFLVIHQWILRLLMAAIGLPMLMCLLFGLAYLLAAVGDDDGSMVVARTNLVLAVLWIFGVLLLVIALAFSAVAANTRRSDEACEDFETGQPKEDL